MFGNKLLQNVEGFKVWDELGTKFSKNSQTKY